MDTLGFLSPDEQRRRDLHELYETDETLWLDRMAELAGLALRRGGGANDEIDYSNLKEFLESMANRDRRATESRLAKLIEHALKWEYQPSRRGGSWRRTIADQKAKLKLLLASGSLRRHAEQSLQSSYLWGADLAAAATGLDVTVFPERCPWTLDELLEYKPV